MERPGDIEARTRPSGGRDSEGRVGRSYRLTTSCPGLLSLATARPHAETVEITASRSSPEDGGESRRFFLACQRHRVPRAATSVIASVAGETPASTLGTIRRRCGPDGRGASRRLPTPRRPTMSEVAKINVVARCAYSDSICVPLCPRCDQVEVDAFAQLFKLGFCRRVGQPRLEHSGTLSALAGARCKSAPPCWARVTTFVVQQLL